MQQREKLLENFDIIELWVLPGQIFENNCSTVVVIAQKKKAEENNLTKVKILVRNTESIKRYFKYHKWDFEFFTNIQGQWRSEPKYKISVSPAEDIFQKICKGRKTIGGITKNVMGIMLPSDYSFSLLQYDGWVPYIANANHFQKYVMSAEMQDDIKFFDYHMSDEMENELKNRFGGLRLRRDYEDIFVAPSKILVKMSSTPGDINCINALVDEEGAYPSHSFFVMVSKDTRISNYVLCALINSKLINAYVRRTCVKRTLTTESVRSIPVPEFTDMQLQQIEQCYLKIKEAYTATGSYMTANNHTVEMIQNEIDNVIFEAFGLEPYECDKINKLFAVYKEKETDICLEEEIHKEYCNVSGQVEEINAETMHCKIYLTEFGEQMIKIEQTMPGWLLRPGTEFSAKYSEGKLFDIKPLMYSYLDDDEVFELLANEMSEG